MKIKTNKISLPLIKKKKIRLFLKRLDLINSNISGNKFYKLKYNLIHAKEKRFKTLLTFGGAYSNHILATSIAASENNFKSIGVIRGEQVFPLNPILSKATNNGMILKYISRTDYRNKDSIKFINQLRDEFGDFYLIPEGGTNSLAVLGTQEILDTDDNHDYICCPVGTGGTISGLINSSKKSQKIIGFCSVNNKINMLEKINLFTNKLNWELNDDYLAGGYAKLNTTLINFINEFYITQNIVLDGIYTSKMLFGILDLINKNYFPPKSKILAIHTGGINGNNSLNLSQNINLPFNL